VGRRLARLALNKQYGKRFVPSGPIYQSLTIEKAIARIRFTYADRGLVAIDNAPLREFEIAGADGHFVAAKAWIDKDNTVIVWSDNVAEPQAVRYAWRNDPRPNLCNKEGLPASPFRTDDLPRSLQSDWSRLNSPPTTAEAP
jgi:sialate O-acetylesterase